jgi:hypothetical protein
MPEVTVTIASEEYERIQRDLREALARLVQLEGAMVAAGVPVPETGAVEAPRESDRATRAERERCAAVCKRLAAEYAAAGGVEEADALRAAAREIREGNT